jgi:hypothetical protein
VSLPSHAPNEAPDCVTTQGAGRLSPRQRPTGASVRWRRFVPAGGLSPARIATRGSASRRVSRTTGPRTPPAAAARPGSRHSTAPPAGSTGPCRRRPAVPARPQVSACRSTSTALATAGGRGVAWRRRHPARSHGWGGGQRAGPSTRRGPTAARTTCRPVDRSAAPARGGARSATAAVRHGALARVARAGPARRPRAT